MELLYILALAIFSPSLASYSSRDLRCLVCRTVIEEMEKEIAKVSPTKKIKVGGYRVDDEGNAQQKYIPLARSEMHLSELMDTICEKMDDYVRATTKATGQLTLLKLMTEGGGMNPNISDVDIIQDSDLNKSLKFYCEGIVEEFEEEFYSALSTDDDNADVRLCGRAAKLCDLEESSDYNFETEKDEL